MFPTGLVGGAVDGGALDSSESVLLQPASRVVMPMIAIIGITP